MVSGAGSHPTTWVPEKGGAPLFAKSRSVGAFMFVQFHYGNYVGDISN